MVIRYKNSLGAVEMYGDGRGIFRICDFLGLSLEEREYSAASFTGCDGQETLFSRALPRTITLGIEASGRNILQHVRDAMGILGNPGYLFLEEGDSIRRIYCNQVKIPDLQRILKGRLCRMAVQFVCDSPFFEDGEDTVTMLYSRSKNLSTPFTLPCQFGTTIMGADIVNSGDMAAEPIISVYCQNALDGEDVILTNGTTGCELRLNCKPEPGEKLVIDIKNRKVTGSVQGNLLGCLSDETFMGDFVLVPGVNRISVFVGNVTSGISVDCRHSNLHREAVAI